MIRIAIYISDHGFGHATRMSALAQDFVNAGIKCYLVCDVSAPLFVDCNLAYVELRDKALDFGMVQDSWMRTDTIKTKTQLELLWERREKIINDEVRFCREERIDFIISDIPFFAFEVAERLQIPACGVSNFEWHFIYNNALRPEDKCPENDHQNGTQLTIFDHDMEIHFIMEGIKKYYEKADFAVRLPFSDDSSMAAFRKVVPGDLLGYYYSPEDRKEFKAQVVEEFRLRKNREIILISFGGFDDNIINLPALYKTGKYIFAKDFGAYNIKNYPRCRLIPPLFFYEKVFAAADIIITKTGYSTFAESVKNDKIVIYTGRKGNPEDKLLLDGIKNYPRSRYIPCEELDKANWQDIFAELDAADTSQAPAAMKNCTEAAAGDNPPAKTGCRNLSRGDFSRCNRNVAVEILTNLFNEAKAAQTPLHQYPRDNRYAVIDVGSNNIQLLWAVITPRKVITVHRAVKTPAMAKGMKDGMLTKEGIERAKEKLTDFVDYSGTFTRNIIVTGTSCSRESRNIEQVSQWLHQQYGITYQILSEEREALLAGLANRRQFRRKPNMVFFDIGGGSTEFIFYRKHEVVFHRSLPIGVRRLINEDKDESYIYRMLAKLPKDIISDPLPVGIGGTVTTLSAVKLGLREYDGKKVHKTELTYGTIEYFQEKFIFFSDDEIADMIPFEPERAEVIRTGVLLIRCIMDYFETDKIIVSDHGIQYGIAEEIRQRMRKSDGKSDDYQNKKQSNR